MATKFDMVMDFDKGNHLQNHVILCSLSAKSFFHSYVIFYLDHIPLISYRGTIRLLLLVREYYLAILAFKTLYRALHEFHDNL